METIQRIGIADPREFFAIPAEWQDAHLEHTRLHIIGWYEGLVKPGAQAVSSEKMHAAAESWRERRSKPPGMREIADAERILATNGLPESVYAAAHESLARLEAP